MTETRKDQLIGGLITLVVGFVGLLLWSWWSNPGGHTGMILITDSEFTERTRSVDATSGKQVAELEMFARDYEFSNIDDDLKNFSILIPIKAADNAPIMVSTQQDKTVVKSVSSPSEIQTLGTIKLEIQSMERGGNLSVRVKAPSMLQSSSLEGPRADVKNIKILTPRTLYIYL
jgi:hypothetical protein